MSLVTKEDFVTALKILMPALNKNLYYQLSTNY